MLCSISMRSERSAGVKFSMAATPIPVIINQGGGTAARAGATLITQVETAFAATGLAVKIEAVAGAAIAERVKSAARGGIVVVGGGDGTLGTAAALCAAAGATMGILPLGTRNHLARELGIPMALGAAAQVIADGHRRRIDLSSVNDHVFVNNASIGFYPAMVRARDDLRARHGLPKWVANFPAGWATMNALRHRRFKLIVDGAAQPVRTGLLFVGNNVYSLALGRMGQRDALDDGKLSLFALAPNSRWGLIGFGLRALVGRTDPSRDFEALGICETLDILAARRRIDVAVDGEIIALAPPLSFRVQPGALSVLAPPVA
jgi:diacylglycerol kinase family enzyme